MLKSLTPDQRRLLVSFFLYALASPMVLVYSNTFLWRQSHDALVLVLFNIGMYASLTVGFFLNAMLLKRFRAVQLFFFGCLLQGAVPIVLVWMQAQASSYALALGAVMGLAQGFFWANRNTITSKFTQGSYRYRFVSLETATTIVAGILSPFIIGWFIAMGETLPTYTVDQAYGLSALIGFLLLAISGTLCLRLRVEPFALKTLFVHGASRAWNRQRWTEALNGFTSGVESVLPLLIILLYVGQEEAVGTIKAATAALSALVILFIGKRVKHKHHLVIVGVWGAFTLAGAGAFALYPGAGGAIALFLLGGLVGAFRWSSFTTVMYEVVDREMHAHGGHRVLYILDREAFLNIGRVVSLGAFLVFYVLAPEAVIRYGLLIAMMTQLPALLCVASLTRGIGRGQTPEPTEAMAKG